jgi:hypothetical protein
MPPSDIGLQIMSCHQSTQQNRERLLVISLDLISAEAGIYKRSEAILGHRYRVEVSPKGLIRNVRPPNALGLGETPARIS